MKFTCARCTVALEVDKVNPTSTVWAPPGWMHVVLRSPAVVSATTDESFHTAFHLCASCRIACTRPIDLGDDTAVIEALHARIAEYGVAWSWNWLDRLPLRAELDGGNGVKGAVWRDGARVYWTVSAPPSLGDNGAIVIGPDSILGIPFKLAMQTVAARVLALLDKQAEDATRRLSDAATA